MSTVRRDFQRMAREAKRQGMPLPPLTENMRKDVRATFEAEYRRFQPRKRR